jgi:transcriptional regulator with AAA-type ATPase domain
VDEEVLAFYAAPGRFTTLDGDVLALDSIGRVVEVVQGLLIYDTDEQLRVGDEVFDVLRGRVEAV